MVRSSTSSPNGQPNPTPENAFSRRLEQVRKQERVPSLRAFWRKLEAVATKDDVLPSYAAVRTYHWDVNPPVTYLVLVGRAFGVSLRWLATEEGPVYSTSAEEEAYWDRVDSCICEEFPEFKRLSASRRHLAHEYVLLLTMFQGSPVGGELPVMSEAAKQLGRALSAPLEHLAIDADKVPLRALAPYVTGVCQAIQNLLAYVNEPGVVGQWWPTVTSDTSNPGGDR